MTPDEIQAMRERHQLIVQSRRLNGKDICRFCYVSYPCDVIKVLDAYEDLLAKCGEKL